MQITLIADNLVIPMSMLLSATLRSDLVPVPLSLEFSVQDKDGIADKLKIGSTLTVADLAAVFVVIKSQPLKTQNIKDGSRIGTVTCVAIPQGCEGLIIPTSNAIILKDTSFNAAIRAGGGKLRLGNDMPLPEFVCLKGTIPTERLACYAQQEAAVIGYLNGKMGAVKIDALMKQTPKIEYDPSAVTWVDSIRIQGLEKAAVISVADDGSTVLGQSKNGIGTVQAARLDTRQIGNMSKVLIRRGSIVRSLSMTLNAGDVVTVDKTKYVILTAAHVVETAALGGNSAFVSKFWLGSL